MTYFETAKLLVKYGALIGIILGIVSIALSGLSIVALLALWSFGIITFAISIGLAIMSIICSFIVYTVYYPKMDEDPKGVFIYLIIFGILMMIGSWGIGGLLVLIGGILVYIEQEEAK